MIRGRIEAVFHHIGSCPAGPWSGRLAGEDARHAVGMQVADLSGDDDPAAAAEHPDIRPFGLLQQVDHVFEIFDVPALVGLTAMPWTSSSIAALTTRRPSGCGPGE